MSKALEIQKDIESALSKIEDVIKEDPSHIDWYVGLKEELLIADSTISFCIND